VANQYAGILINADLVVQPQHENGRKRAQVGKTKSPTASHLNLVKIKVI
jgi:hypothetical protein